MFSRLSLVFVYFFSLSIVRAQNIDVQHYNFNITLRDDVDSISGVATIDLKFLANTDKLQLDLTSIGTSKGMEVVSVWEGKSTDKPLDFQHQSDKLTVTLANPASKEETHQYSISYRGIPSDGLIISKNKYRHRTFFADNWPNRGHNWLPCNDTPGDKASVEFVVTAPDHYQVVSNGLMIEGTNLTGNKKLTHWKEEVPISTKVMVIGAADFAVNLAGTINGCIPVYSWVYPEDRDKGFYDYAQATEILPFFIQYVGPYGFKKLANVQSKTTFGGLENANTIFYAENTVNGKRLKEDLLAHEIAHQWFGNMATEKSFAHLWLSEGFATYMTILYMENKYGKDTSRAMLKEDRSQIIAFVKNSQRSVVDETSNFMDLLNANSYQKGGWVLHMLRRQLGDVVFQKSIRSYYETYAGKTADTRDLQRIFEKTSGKDLSVFFDQWLFQPGIPVLNIKWSYRAADKKLVIDISQTQKHLFAFPLEIKLKESNGKSVVKTLNIEKATQQFTISVQEKPATIELDPNLSLLFKGDVFEAK